MTKTDVIKRLRNKIWLILSSSFYGLILTGLIIVYLFSHQRTQDNVYQALYSRLLSGQTNDEHSFFSAEIMGDGQTITIYSSFELGEHAYLSLIELVFANDRDYNIVYFEEDSWVYAIIPVGEVMLSPEEGYQRIIFVNITDFIQAQNATRQVLVTIGLVSLVLVLAGCFVISNIFVKSTRSSFEQQLHITSSQRRFTANATHELKTPITMIKGSYDEILSNKDQTIESQIKWFEMINFGIQRMENLTSELLTLAKLENENETIELDKVDLNVSQVVNITVQVMQTMANAKGIKISGNIQPDIHAHLNEEKFKQVLMIFLDNAIKYVNDQGRIEVHLLTNENKLIASVHNTGPGIPAKDLPQIFERFYRLSTTPKGKTGTGLGLPIAKEIVEQLGGTVALESVVNEVTSVIMEFPLT